MGAFEVMNNSFRSKPMGKIVECDELAQFTDGEGDIRASGNSEIHEEADETMIWQVLEFKLLFRREGGIRVARKDKT